MNECCKCGELLDWYFLTEHKNLLWCWDCLPDDYVSDEGMTKFELDRTVEGSLVIIDTDRMIPEKASVA